MTDYTPTTEDVRVLMREAVGSSDYFDRWLAAHDAEVAAKALKSVIDKVDLEAIADEWSDGGEDSNRHWAAGNAASTVLNLLYDARTAEIRKAAEQ